MIKKIVTIIMSISFTFILFACSNNQVSTTSGTQGSTTQGTTTPDKITIVHAMGQTEIPTNPKRIVILTNEGTEALLALGVKPVGAVKSWVGEPWYPHISEQMSGVTVVGTESAVNLEEILKLEPDLIIGNKLRQEGIYEQLSLIAPTVFSETLRGEWKNNFQFYAQVLGLETEGQTLLNEYQAKITTVKTLAETKNLLDKEIAVIRFMAGSTRLYLEQSFSGIILNEIGFARTLATDPSGNNFMAQITQEQLLDIAKNTDIIIYFTYESGSGGATTTKLEWINSDIFKSLPAYINNQVYEVNDAIWNTSGGILSANKAVDELLVYVNNNF